MLGDEIVLLTKEIFHYYNNVVKIGRMVRRDSSEDFGCGKPEEIHSKECFWTGRRCVMVQQKIKATEALPYVCTCRYLTFHAREKVPRTCPPATECSLLGRYLSIGTNVIDKPTGELESQK